MIILAGDIGGTKTVLGLFERKKDGLCLRAERTFASAKYASLEAIIAEFVDAPDSPTPKLACFGVAGPVIDGRCQTTNLPWILEEAGLATAAGADRAKLINDLEAAAFGMLHLPADALVALNPGAQPGAGNVAVIAAGTGLGEAMLYWDGARYHAIPSEGGHCSLAPSDAREDGLLRYLREGLGGHVSWERVLSGPGLYNIYQYLKDSGFAPQAPEFAEALADRDASALVSRRGMEGHDPLCAEALRMFCRLYGAEAGNLALKILSVGGVFVGGGIAKKILPALTQGAFMEGFRDKGRFKPLLSGMAVQVATDPRAPLIGAAYYRFE